MENIYWKRSDIVRHHMAALSFLRRISSTEPSDVLDANVKKIKPQNVTDTTIGEIKINSTNANLLKYVENIQRKKILSISKEAFSDNLYLLRFKAGDLYENEISYQNILDNVMAHSENVLSSKIVTHETLPYHNVIDPLFIVSPKKFFKNELFFIDKAFNSENLKDVTESIPLTHFTSADSSNSNFLANSDLLTYTEDIYERYYTQTTNTTSFLLNSNKFEKVWKRRINDEFKQQFPNINITLTKFISLKREMKKVVINECELDPINLAYAYSYFDTLVNDGWVNKFNRKICAALSITFAAKLHDIKGEGLKELFEELENTFRLDKNDIIAYEMPCFLALDFDLNLPREKIMRHYDKIMTHL